MKRMDTERMDLTSRKLRAILIQVPEVEIMKTERIGPTSMRQKRTAKSYKIEPKEKIYNRLETINEETQTQYVLSAATVSHPP